MSRKLTGNRPCPLPREEEERDELDEFKFEEKRDDYTRDSACEQVRFARRETYEIIERNACSEERIPEERVTTIPNN